MLVCMLTWLRSKTQYLCKIPVTSQHVNLKCDIGLRLHVNVNDSEFTGKLRTGTSVGRAKFIATVFRVIYVDQRPKLLQE